MASFFKLSFLLAFAVAPISAHASTYVFLLAGQSNMAGRGQVSQSTYVSNSSILSYSDGSYATTAGISTATNLLALDYNTMNGTQLGPGPYTSKSTQVGPGGFFASALLPNLPAGSNILLVNVAWGGTTVSDWLPNGPSGSAVEANYQKSVNLYNNALNTYDAAWSAANSGGLNPVVGGILWLQGESDVSTAKATYISNTETVLGGFRSALLANYGSTPKIVIGEIAKEVANGDNVRAAQAQIASELGAGFASSTGLANDGLHFTSAGQLGMGQRMEAAYVAIPEPSSFGLMGVGALAIGFVRRRSKHTRVAA